jgi:hypothetical protein
VNDGRKESDSDDEENSFLLIIIFCFFLFICFLIYLLKMGNEVNCNCLNKDNENEIVTGVKSPYKFKRAV